MEDKEVYGSRKEVTKTPKLAYYKEEKVLNALKDAR